ncbi:M23 family metallopeptidase [Deinococcus aerophilus]|uniref:Peptidase M23 n=1 Tax=Deinococcus aerophilus TaxID=522488 RepID=A0ABQ2GQN5_9DEIO|nr:M23 family metallopeptidase [Deinococcus aerophilus]GGM07045.1 peptidase M23 [Deinococcus aerophilus]
MAFLFFRGRRWVPLAAALIGAAVAQTPPLPLPAPLDLLTPTADVVLRPDPGGQSLRIVTDGQTTERAVARRYGVGTGAVRTIASDAGVRVREVRLAEAAVARAPARPASVVTYRVRSGDTLAGVAARHDLTVLDVLSANLGRTSLDRLRPGETLNLPTRERGLLLTIKPGQSALSLIAGYGADLVATARANDVLPTALRVGDQLLLPGVKAEGLRERLLAAREAERKAKLARERQQQYEQYLSWKADRERQALQEKYARQEKYEAYLAWKSSPERQRQMAAYERQAQYEAAQAAAQARARNSAQAAAVVGASVGSTVAGTGGRLAWPLRSYRLTSRYGERDIAFHQQVFHGGIDLAAPYGTPVYAATAGTVASSGYGAFGLNVWTTSGDSTAIYGHLSRTAVVSGQHVTPGQVLGYVGCTGVCTGPHLHFELRLGGQTVDPLSLLP